MINKLCGLAFVAMLIAEGCAATPLSHSESEVTREAIKHLSNVLFPSEDKPRTFSVLRTTMSFCKPIDSEDWLGDGCVFPPDLGDRLLHQKYKFIPNNLGNALVTENENSVDLRAEDVSPNALLSPAEQVAYSKAGSTIKLKKKARWGGFVQLTKPVFSSDLQVALIYLTVFCGGDCGYGWFFVLERRDGSWHLVEKQLMFIS